MLISLITDDLIKQNGDATESPVSFGNSWIFRTTSDMVCMLLNSQLYSFIQKVNLHFLITKFDLIVIMYAVFHVKSINP